MRTYIVPICLSLILIFNCTSVLGKPLSLKTSNSVTPLRLKSDSSSIYIRINQVGYLSKDYKLALVLTSKNLEGIYFQIYSGSELVLNNVIGKDRGAYGSFAHLYELEFTHLIKEGTYILTVMDAIITIRINNMIYNDLIKLSFQFLQGQRCGDTDPIWHGPCHLLDGLAKGGYMNGQKINASGGWHDAGDYIKFLVTTAYTADLLLAAYLRRPKAFSYYQKSYEIPTPLIEAKIGVEWLLNLWDPVNNILYYQVSDESDHSRWRMPEGDIIARPVYACDTAKGGNMAGKSAATLALAYVVWNDSTASFYDAELAAKYLKAAKEIYAYGQKRPQSQPKIDFYGDNTWNDDMSLAAVELYRATMDSSYLEQAHSYIDSSETFERFSWNTMHAFAHYELASVDYAHVPFATSLFRSKLEKMQTNFYAQPFQVSIPKFFWGSNEIISNNALLALWYEDLSSDSIYRAMAISQRDFILGKNPWGICFVSGAGNTWPKHPASPIADLSGFEHTGFWDEGATTLQEYQSQEINLKYPDIYAEFQTNEAVYHDDTEDYVTNEPTITMNAAGIALLAWFASDSLTQTGTDDKSNSLIPNHFELYQNYPNPFNSNTSISFYLNESGYAKLSVFDTLGEEVKVLVNELKSAGNHSVSFDGANLSSDIYFYKFQFGHETTTKKMILLK